MTNMPNTCKHCKFMGIMDEDVDFCGNKKAKDYKKIVDWEGSYGCKDFVLYNPKYGALL